MADEVVLSQVDGSYDLAYMARREDILQALRQGENILELVTRYSLVGEATDTLRVPLAPTIAASSIADGTDLTNTPYAPTFATATVAEVGVMITPTDFNLASTFVGNEQYMFDIGTAVAEKLTTDLAGLVGGFSNVTGTTTSDLTEQQFRDAITALRARKVRGPHVAVLHDQQENDLVTSIGSSVTAAATTGTSPREVLNDLAAEGAGSLGVIFKTVVHTNALVPTANAGADRAGGVFAPAALGYVEKWSFRLEMERNASLRATELVGTSAYAVFEVDDTRGQSIVTDA